MRTCDGLGYSLILIGYTPRPEGKTLEMVKKTSIGAEKTVPWEYYEHSQEVLSSKTDSLHIGIEINQRSKNIFEYYSNNQIEDCYLWFGNEISGLTELVQNSVSHLLHLPMTGSKESLNVATSVTATGYILSSFEYMNNSVLTGISK